jgi:hypothetical protein
MRSAGGAVVAHRWQHVFVTATVLVPVWICAVVPSGASAAVVEWTLHKSADGAHPDGREQQYLWLMNRARHDPGAEGWFLATIEDPLIASRLRGFQVDLDLLRAEFDAIPSMPPAAFDARLYEAARAHSLDMIARDRQDHSGQKDRVNDSGFQSLGHRGNAYAFSQYGLEGHTAFNVDWGGRDGTGMQPGRPHRQAIMSVDASLTNVGLAVLADSDPGTQVGPFVVTGNYERADDGVADHHNRFLVGTVWADFDGNGRYDDGEGIEGVTVTPDSGPYFAVSAAGGGYAIPVLAPGTLAVHFAGGGVPQHTRTVAVGTTSVLVDYAMTEDLTNTFVPEPSAVAQLLASLVALTTLARRTRGRPRKPDPGADRSANTR